MDSRRQFIKKSSGLLLSTATVAVSGCKILENKQRSTVNLFQTQSFLDMCSNPNVATQTAKTHIENCLGTIDPEIQFTVSTIQTDIKHGTTRERFTKFKEILRTEYDNPAESNIILDSGGQGFASGRGTSGSFSAGIVSNAHKLQFFKNIPWQQAYLYHSGNNNLIRYKKAYNAAVTVVHELGHSLGLNHSDGTAWEVGTVPNSEPISDTDLSEGVLVTPMIAGYIPDFSEELLDMPPGSLWSKPWHFSPVFHQETQEHVLKKLQPT